MAKMCIVFFICTVTAVSSDAKTSVSGRPSGSYTALTELNDLQEDFVRGTIKDATTGEPLIGVTVMVKGTTLGTLTDINGQFSLRIPERQATLAVSFIGYATQEIAVTQGSTINVSMQLELTQIQEVVVVG